MSSSFWLSVRRAWPLGIALLVALLVRSLLWGNLPRQGMVSDEAEYLASAVWLAQGRGFSWHGGWLWTRAPLYPLFLAVHLRLFGITVTPIYVSQTLLGLLQVALVYILAHYACSLSEATDRWRHFLPGVAASLVGLYFPLAVYNQVLLSETLYITILLAAFVVLAYWQAIGGGWARWRARGLLLLAGMLLGLATLTRGLAIGFVLVAAGWVWLGATHGAWKDARRLWRTLVGSAILILGAMLMVLPWTIYASRQYGGLVVVDTTGAFNLLLGARTAYDGDRKDAPTRNFVQALLDPRMGQRERERYLQQSCLWQHNDPRMSAALNQSVTDITQADRQQLMSAEGTCLLRERPLAFVGKSLAEFIDFFRINYGGDERFTDGFTTGRLAPAYVLATFLLDDTIYLLAVPLAVIGWTLARTTNVSCLMSRVSTLIAFWWLYNLLAAPLLFAINRFRVPLMPFLLIYATYGLLALMRGEWRELGRRQIPHLVLAAVLMFIVAAPASWISAYNPTTQSYTAQESYFGPHPSSVVDTWLALRSRSSFQQTVLLQKALGAGDAQRAQQVLAAGGLPQPTALLGEALLAGIQKDPAAGLATLPEARVLADPDRGWQAQAGVVRGDLLRQMGDLGAARAAFTPRVVDDYNPVEWAWNWLHPSPAPDGRIDFGGNLDLGYIRGFYLGEGDRETRTTWRWSGAEASLRFPAAGTGAPQTLHLRIDGSSVDLPDPQFSVWIDGTKVATQSLSRDVRVYDVPLPASPSGADVIVTLRAPVFVPPAADLLAQQGPQVGQLRLLGLRLDWAELR